MACVDRCGAPSWRDERVPLPEMPPRCPHCGAFARPGVVWFGESLSERDVAAALEATDCDVFLTVGTSALVFPAAGFAFDARRRGALTVEINLDETVASSAVDLTIRGLAEEVLPALYLDARRSASDLS
jgi:NAD-dependent SIR2 family protein deacetylase